MITSRHRRWEDQNFVDRLNREMDELTRGSPSAPHFDQLFLKGDNIQMSEVETVDLDLENKEPNETVPLPPMHLPSLANCMRCLKKLNCR